MTTTPSFIELAGADTLAEYISLAIRSQRDLPDAARRQFDESVLRLCATNSVPLNALLRDDHFVHGHRPAVQALLCRAFELAPDMQTRAAVRYLSKHAGENDLLPRPTPEPRVSFTASQARVLGNLEAMARLYFYEPERADVRLRLEALVVGASGVGKTFLIHQLGARLEIPVIKLTMGDWMPLGGRGGIPTMTMLAKVLSKNERVILYIDELCKMRSMYSSAWTLCIATEAFGLLDRQPGPEWSKEAALNLKKNAFLVGSGTWQELFDLRDKTSVGFGSGQTNAVGEIQRLVRKHQLIPPELLNRFNDDWGILDPYSENDFRRMIRELGLEPGVIDPVAAAESGLNFRAIENALTAHPLRRSRTHGASLDCS